MKIAYRGTAYSGWQIQPHRETVQGTVNRALSKILQEAVRTVGSSRTDAGVHARAQCVSFSCHNPIPAESLQRALNYVLPHDMHVFEVQERDALFSARYHARAKQYSFCIFNRAELEPMTADLGWRVAGGLNDQDMDLGAKTLVGTRCFRALQAAADKRTETVTTIYAARVRRLNDLVVFDVIGRNFLYHMVRNLAGSLIKVGVAEWTVAEFEDRINSGERTQMAMTAPAAGLHLIEVFYGARPFLWSESGDAFVKWLSDSLLGTQSRDLSSSID